MESNNVNLIDSSNNVLVRYPTSFWLIAIIVVLVTSALFYVNNFSQKAQDVVFESASNNSKKIEVFINEIENDSISSISSLLEVYKSNFFSLDTEVFLTAAEKTINTMYSPLMSKNEAVTAYYYILNDSENSSIKKIYNNTGASSNNLNIKHSNGEMFDEYIIDKSIKYSKPFWDICVSETGEERISYIIPLGDNLGVVGVIFSNELLFGLIDRNSFNTASFPLILHADNGTIVPKNSVNESLKKILASSDYDDLGVISLKDEPLSFFYNKLNEDLIYIEAHSLAQTRLLSNIYILCLGIVSLLCVWIIQGDRLTGKNFFDFVYQKSIGRLISVDSPYVTLNSYASAIAFHITLAFALIFQFLLSLFAYDEPIVSLFYLVVLLLCSVSFVIYKKDASDNIYACIFIFFITITPIAMHFILGGYTPEREPYETFWIVCAVLISVFLLSRKYSQVSFSLTVIVVLISVAVELFYFNSVSSIEIIAFSMNIIFVCLLVYSSVEIFYNKSKKDFAKLREDTIQIKETQSAFVHKEKMVTLGQLIAGVAHEINTPIGAVKAAGETLETISNKMLGKLISETKDYSKDDLDVFLQLVNMCTESIKEMRSTMETRKSKVVIREYFKSVGLDNYIELTNLVTKLEICDIEKIDDNLDLFFNPRIIDFLKMVNVVIPFLNGTQTVIFASNRVAKIVFALKTFAHTSSSSEFVWYDIAKNIENIIILYHNQIKAGIEIIQDYDDNVPDLFGNPDEIGQVWTNLVQNAIYAMSGVGTLKISIYNVDNKWVRISFTDTGTGIKEESLKNIFEPFFTTKPLGEGSGLGLDICKKIIEKHDGTIEASSKYGSGTTFSVSLPIKDKE